MTMKVISGVKRSMQVKKVHFSCHNRNLCDVNVNVMVNLYFICNLFLNNFVILNFKIEFAYDISSCYA
jgi:hypothetical protein